MSRPRKTIGGNARITKVRPRFTAAELDALIEEGTVDAYGDEEQRTGLFTMIEDNLALPFETEVLGMPVTVERVDLTTTEEIMAICRRGVRARRCRSWSCPCPNRRPGARNGSRPTDAGRATDK